MVRAFRYTYCVLEIAILLCVLLAVPVSPWYPLVVLVAVLCCLPGAYATWVGAPYIPTSAALVARMVALAAIRPGQTVYDVGCGDGRLLRAAAAQGAYAIGYELSIPTYLWCRLRCLLTKNVTVRFGDFWKRTDFADADVIFCFLLTDTMQTFQATIWPQLKTGCRVVSHSFRMQGVAPDEEEEKVVVYIKKA